MIGKGRSDYRKKQKKQKTLPSLLMATELFGTHSQKINYIDKNKLAIKRRQFGRY